MTAIETDGLTKRYGDETVLDGLDLTVEEGEVFGFLGPNGAGKTTTIDILLDFISATSGSATVLGHDTRAEATEIRERVGVLPDGFQLWGRSSGYRHLEFAIESLGGDESPDDLLEQVGLTPEDASRRVGGYSKGMKQRLGIAMALVSDPDLLIMDEPSSGLDPNGIQRMQRIVREVADDGTSVFFSSHILGQVASVCDRVGILDEGELITVDTLEGLRTDVGVSSNLLVEVDDRVDGALVEDLESIDGVSGASNTGGTLDIAYTAPKAKAPLIHQLVESGVDVTDFVIQEPTLEDVFSAFTGGDESSGHANGSGDTSRDAATVDTATLEGDQ